MKNYKFAGIGSKKLVIIIEKPNGRYPTPTKLSCCWNGMTLNSEKILLVTEMKTNNL